MNDNGTTNTTQPLSPASLQLLGRCVSDLIQSLGKSTSATPLENALLREAVTEAIEMLSNREQTAAWLKAQRGIEPSEMPPIALSDLAQTIIDQAFSDGFSPAPPQEEQQARVEFALSLDPTCADAYIIKGSLHEAHRSYPAARASYEQAMQVTAAKLGIDAFTQKAHEDIHFWLDLETRPYMRARAALAFLLWRHLGLLKEATQHFQALLTLNPGDNQGNRYALLCCLLEAGDDTALEHALERTRTYTDEDGETYQITDTCWHYIHACWQFRKTPPPADDPTSGEATKALRKAFKHNRHVPHLLLHPQARRLLPDLGHYAPGDIQEAAWFVDFARKGWTQTEGALTWLQAVASKDKLLRSGKTAKPQEQ